MALRRILVAAAACAAAAVVILSGPASATFPGGSGRLVYASNVSGQLEIYTANPDGSDAVNLTNDGAVDQDPAWSPDGTRIAFASNRAGDSDVYVMNADGSGVVKLTDSELDDTDPAWSPDGSRIAFVSTRSQNAGEIGESSDEIWVMNADGTDPVRLTVNRGLDDDPAWSPDGERIAWSHWSGSTGLDVWIMNADGSGQVQLTVTDGDDERPSWSPDAKLILFTSQRAGGTGFRGGGSGRVFSMAPDGSAQVEVSDTITDKDPAWSPDGEHIVFASTRDGGDTELYLANADGTDVVRLIANDGNEMEPDWQPAPPGSIPPSAFADSCTIRGSVNDDTIVGTPHADVICGLGGDDVLRGLGGPDKLLGGEGDDTLVGGLGADVLDGEAGEDEAIGGPGRDVCRTEIRTNC
jgi:Tol biopolymer transport system component